MAVPLHKAAAQLTLSTPRTTLGAVIKQIEAQSNYKFFYNDRIVNIAVEPLKVSNAPLERVLTTALKNTGVVFKVDENIVYLSESTAAQTPKRQDVSGRVTDSKGEPLIGVSVLVKGTTTGTTTGIDGNYKLSVTGTNITLTFSYIGYTEQQVALNNRTTVDVTLSDDALSIENVVVTALGIKRAQKALSYNVQQVSEKDILLNKDVNFINALSGKVAGVTINTGSAGPGGASKVVMRGSKSIEQSSNALYVIDGIPMYNLTGDGGQAFDSRGTTEAIADINPEDIESMSVLTGAAAAALYGSHAANGAIVITTKKGKEGHLSLTLSQNTEFLSPLKMPTFQNRYGTGDRLSADGTTDKSWGKRLNSTNRMGYSPASDFLRTGVVTTENVTLSTGTDKNQFYFSAGVVNSKGAVPNNKYTRYNFTARNTAVFLKDRMTFDVSASYIRQSDRNMVNQGTYSNPLVTAYLFPRGNDWDEYRMFERYDTGRGIYTQFWPNDLLSSYAGQNPYWIAYRNIRENNKERYMLSGTLSYRILDWLSVNGRVRIDNSTNDYTKKLYATSNTTLTEGSDNGFFGIDKSTEKQTYADLLVNIDKIYRDVFSIHANIGASLSDMKQNVMSNEGPIRKDGIPNMFNILQLDDVKTKRTQSGYREQTQSVFASLELGFKNAYFLTLTGRSDWPSQLSGPNSVKSAFFYPSVGASVVLSEIIPMPKQISYMKLRSSFASVGLPFPRFLANPTFVWDNANKTWSTKSHYPLYNLKPEKTNSFEVGLTLKFLKHFDFDLGLYTTKTYNQTFEPKISVSSKYSTIYVQTGSVRNRGVELSLGYKNEWSKFRWASNVVFSANRNKILELLENYVHPETGEVITKERLDVGGFAQARFVLKKGGSLGDLYSTADLVRDSNGRVYIDKSGNVAGNYKAEDIRLGSVFPRCNLSWRNDFAWNGFNFGFMLSARIGGITYSATQAALDLYGVSESSAAARDAGGVVVNGRDAVNPEKWYSVVASQGGIPQFYTYSATNIRLQEASIGYTLPKAKFWGIADVTVSLVGRNLWMIYCRAPFDPESVATTGNYYQGIDNFMMPSMRSVGFNVRFKF